MGSGIDKMTAVASVTGGIKAFNAATIAENVEEDEDDDDLFMGKEAMEVIKDTT